MSEDRDPPTHTHLLESDPATLRGYCQQLLDMFENYGVYIEGEDNDLIAHISRNVDPAHVGSLANTEGSAACGAHQRNQTLTQEQCADLVDQMLQEPGWAANHRSRLALTVAARTIRRGRALGSHEKWENIKAFCEANGDD